ncbi:hypothetical protein B0H10DRAFT_1955054 [Mycena sp. CBHHK59/15]|nr:hypothetical protein B0H10DRAFT_1955054 [Mycena sp. CBHHK59/15]
MSHPRSTLVVPASPPAPRSASSPSQSGTATPWTYSTTANGGGDPAKDDKDLPLPPPVLQPLRKHETTGRAPPPQRRAAQPPPQHGLGWLVVLPGVVVALLSAGFATCLFLYLAVPRGSDAPSFYSGFYVDETTGDGARLRGLTGSTVITNIVWLGCPVLISMIAYCVAGSWLSHQQHPRSERPNLPTPLQYGLLVKMLSAPSLGGSVYQSGSYLLNRKKRVAVPPLFTTAFLLTTGVLTITYLISIADIWLHAASSVVYIIPPAPSPHADAFNDLSDTAAPQTPPRLRAHYPLAPALTYLTLLYLHALTATLLTLWAASLRSPRVHPVADPAIAGEKHSTTWRPHTRTAVRLAHTHLTDALALVAARLSTRGRGLGMAMFVEDMHTARVEIGVWERERLDGDTRAARRRWGDRAGDRVFGVYKKVVPYKGEIY